MLLGVIAISNILIVMMSLWVCICVKIYQLYILTYYVYYTSKIFLKTVIKDKGIGTDKWWNYLVTLCYSSLETLNFTKYAWTYFRHFGNTYFLKTELIDISLPFTSVIWHLWLLLFQMTHFCIVNRDSHEWSFFKRPATLWFPCAS